MRLRDPNKEAIVKEKACQLLVELGFEGFSMNKLAKACNISVGTLYIYYKDKENLIQNLGIEFSQAYYDAMLDGFSTEMSFKEGLWIQWQNRAKFAIEHPLKLAFHDIIQQSNHKDFVMEKTHQTLVELFSQFIANCIARKQIKDVPYEVLWSVAYGPLYTLIRFHHKNKSFGQKGYTLNKNEMEEAFNLVVNALSL